MALALHLFLLLLLAVALPARAAQAAPWPARGADEQAENVDPAAWMDASFDHLRFPGGSPSGDYADIGDKKSLEASKLLDKMLGDLERRRAMKEKNVQMLEHTRGSNGSVPAPDEGKEEMAGTGSGTGEVLGKSNTDAKNPSSSRRVFCPQDVRKTCMIGTVVTLFTVPLSMVLCYVGFRWWKERKHRPAAAPASRPRRRDSPSPPESPRTTWFDISQTGPQQQQLPRKAEHQPSVSPPRPPSPAVKQKPPEIPPPPPLPSQPPWAR